MKIDYPRQVFCNRCSKKYLKEDVELVPRYGYKCPDCGNKCRTKAHYNYKRRRILSPYIKTGRRGRYIVDEIKAIAQKARLE